MLKKNSFLKDDRGLVTIEWVAIAALAFVAAFAIAGTLMTGANTLGGAVSGQMTGAADAITDPP